ncbi:MAG: hypothetical protein FMFV1_gp4 [Hangzhou merodon fulcratus virga-like virus 1]|nr:MAG: hypothetical protein FMFV1_gp4 [Hangzhou merodon fulcratus virga-like virus 1]
MEYLKKFWNYCNRNIARDFTRASITAQKRLAVKIAAHFVTDVYLFDESNYFANAEDGVVDGLRYKKKDGKYALLSISAQQAMRNRNEYLQFNTNTDDVACDNIGVFLLFEAVLLPQFMLVERSKRICELDKRPSINERIEILKDLVKNFENLNKESEIITTMIEDKEDPNLLGEFINKLSVYKNSK